MGKFSLVHASNPTNGEAQSEDRSTDHSSGYQERNPSTQSTGDSDVFVIRYPESLKNIGNNLVYGALTLVLLATLCFGMAVVNISILIVEFGIYAKLRGQDNYLLLLSECPIIPYGTLIGLSVLYFICLLILTDIIRFEPS
jgi:hypothetical protein